MSAGNEAKQRELKKKHSLETAISQAEEVYSNVENFAKLICRYTDVGYLLQVYRVSASAGESIAGVTCAKGCG